MVQKNSNAINNLIKLLNENISAQEVLLINEDGSKSILSKHQALLEAKKLGLDLFCLSPQANPPVCKILDYQKYLYQLKKKSNPQTNKNVIKEAKFSFHIGEGDLQVKIKKVIDWLEEGYAGVRIDLVMRGREQGHKDIALEKCQKIIHTLQINASNVQTKGEIKLNKNVYSIVIYKKK